MYDFRATIEDFSVNPGSARAQDARLAIVAVSVALGWPSTRTLTIDNIAKQLGCTLATLTRSIARFKALAGLDSDAAIRPGAGPGGDKPAAVQSVGNIPEEPALIAL
jgi:hypothetical protein